MLQARPPLNSLFKPSLHDALRHENRATNRRMDKRKASADALARAQADALRLSALQNHPANV